MTDDDPIYGRPQKRGISLRVRPFEEDFSNTHFELLGRVSVYFNYLENAVDRLLVESLEIPSKLHLTVTTRFNGIDAKTNIIKQAVKIPPLPRGSRELIASAVGTSGVEKLKNYRNRIIHATMIDTKNHIGASHRRQGNFAEIYLHPEVLFGVAERIRHLTNEIKHHSLTVRLGHQIKSTSAKDRERVERIQEHQLSSHRSALEDRQFRDEMTPLPKLPPAPTYLEPLYEGSEFA